jgi:hypothetical protein
LIRRECPVVFATRGPGFHFFGYYDKSPFDRAGRRLLSHHGRFDSRRMPTATDTVELGYWDLEAGSYQPVASTRAFNWQQGAQLAWLPPDYESRILYNDREGKSFVSRILDLGTGATRTLPLPMYAIHPGGGSAVCANYERLYHTHPGYAYEGIVNLRWDGPLPLGDGLWRLDLETGEHRLVVSTEALVGHRPVSSMHDAVHYLEHAMFNPDGSRFHFLHRWRLPDGGIYTRLFSADEWGGDLRCAMDTGGVSHCCWRGRDRIVAWARPAGKITGLRRARWASRYVLRPLLPLWRVVARAEGVRRAVVGETYYVVDERNGGITPLAPGLAFPSDGHPSWHPREGRWMLTDTYQDEAFHRHLLLYDADERRLIEIGSFPTLPETCDTGYRCDLHPRWDHSGRRVCIDSNHEGERQMYVLDVSPVTGGGETTSPGSRARARGTFPG